MILTSRRRQHAPEPAQHGRLRMSGNTRTSRILARWMSLLLLLMLLSGCATIGIGESDPRDFHAQRRSDALSTGQFSHATRSALLDLGIDAPTCRRQPQACLDRLMAQEVPMDDRRLAILAEAALTHALHLEQQAGDVTSISEETIMAAYLKAASFAYAFIFMGERTPAARALEDRQTQVRDYYNFATERVAALLFRRARQNDLVDLPQPGQTSPLRDWHLTTGQQDLSVPEGMRGLEAILPPSRLRIRGLNNIYRRDGLGASLVAEWRPEDAGRPPSEWTSIGFSPTTILLHFEGDDLQEVLSQSRARMDILDPFQRETVDIRGFTIPVAADFTAAYAVWLARSGFRREALWGTLGRAHNLQHPRIYLMQPYDPERSTVIMLHGLASSPEAWANLANEVLGDERLRANYQIWHVHYPTNAPIAINRGEIFHALKTTLSHLDPYGQGKASRDLVLIGHSMGGVIARLLVVESREEIWAELAGRSTDDPAFQAAFANLEPYIHFTPLEGVNRAVFLASPHAGTPFAGNWLSRVVSNLIRLPGELVQRISSIADAIAQDMPETSARLRDTPNAIDQLYEANPFLQATSRMDIAPGIPYHSIIGRRSADGPVEASSDGVVPFTSAYLPGAVSTLVVEDGHSLQSNHQVIMEIRRILEVHLNEASARRIGTDPPSP